MTLYCLNHNANVKMERGFPLRYPAPGHLHFWKQKSADADFLVSCETFCMPPSVSCETNNNFKMYTIVLTIKDYLVRLRK